MVRLNKNLLSTNQLEELFIQFTHVAHTKSALETGLILQEVLGKEERVMVAKRIAIIVLIAEGRSLYNIANVLKVSPATAEKIKKNLDSGSYDSILKKLGKSKKSYFEILNTIDSILHLGGILPHYNGLERYKGVR